MFGCSAQPGSNDDDSSLGDDDDSSLGDDDDSSQGDDDDSGSGDDDDSALGHDDDSGGDDDDATSLPAWTDLSAGRTHSCGIDPAGALQCWGDNTDGQTTVPTGTFVQVSAGWYHSCALDAAAVVSCWGRDTDGQCNVPQSVLFSAVSAGNLSSCGVTLSGDIECWGGPSGVGIMPPVGSVTSVTVSYRHNCTVNANSQRGRAHCWGRNAFGQNDFDAANTYSQVSAGFRHSCALTTGGEVHCIGQNDLGQTSVPTMT